VSESPVSESEEKALVALAVDGDTQAFTRLFDRYYDRIYRHIYYRVGRVEDAEDLAQQVFLQAWRALGRYRQTDSPFVAWLFTIAHNNVVSFYRRLRPAASLEASGLDWPAAADTEGMMEAGLDHERVRQAIRHLRLEYQQVLVLRFLEDLPYRDIAGALGKSEVHIRVMQHRALQELRRVLDEGQH